MKQSAELVIEFYDSPKDTLGRSLVSVDLQCTDRTSVDGPFLASLFLQFYSKIETVLRRSPKRRALQMVVENSLVEGLSKATDVIHGSDYSLELVERKSKPEKYVKAIFFRNGAVKTKFSWGGEEYYVPMSVIAFLQYIVWRLNDDDFASFNNMTQQTRDGHSHRTH